MMVKAKAKKKKVAKRAKPVKAKAAKRAPARKKAASARAKKPARRAAKAKAKAPVAAHPSKAGVRRRPSTKQTPDIRLALTPPARVAASPRVQSERLAMAAAFSLEQPIEPVHRRPTLTFERQMPPHDLEE